METDATTEPNEPSTGLRRGSNRPQRWLAGLYAIAVLVMFWLFGPWLLLGLVLLLVVPWLRRGWIGWHWLRVIGGVVAVAAVAALAVVVIPGGRLPIPQGPGILLGPSYVGAPATPTPIEGLTIASSPVMAPVGRNSMHNDLWSTDAYTWSGPLGKDPQVKTVFYGIEECATIAFDSQDRIIALCGDLNGPVMHVLDPETMRSLAERRLPDRKPSSDGKKPWEDLCGGAYFYLDNSDQAVVATTDRRIVVESTADDTGAPELRQVASYELGDLIPKSDCLIALMPDVHGTIFWITRHGLVGTLDPATGHPQVFDTGEEIANSMAGDEDGGIYVVSVSALYRFQADDQGRPLVDWRSTYDRGTKLKPGMLSQGSGTTPTVLPNDLVVINDNAEPRSNVVFYNRATGSEVCKAPVFEAGRSASENALVAVGPDSVVMENNYGYTSPLSAMFGRGTTPGYARVDADVATRTCSVAWTNNENGPTSVPKSSLANGLIYGYTKKSTWLGVDRWYFTGMDARTGKTAFSVRTGTGALMNNHYAAIYLAPNGDAYIATLGGLVRIRDTP